MIVPSQSLTSAFAPLGLIAPSEHQHEAITGTAEKIQIDETARISLQGHAYDGRGCIPFVESRRCSDGTARPLVYVDIPLRRTEP